MLLLTTGKNQICSGGGYWYKPQLKINADFYRWFVYRTYCIDTDSDGFYLEPTGEIISRVTKVKPPAKTIFEPPLISSFVVVIRHSRWTRCHNLRGVAAGGSVLPAPRSC